MFAAELSEAGSRGRGGAISPGQEEGGTFHCQEALTDKLINPALGDDRVLYEVRCQGVEAPDRRAPWRRGYNTGRHRCDVEDGSGSTCSSVARLASLQGGHVIGYARVTMNRCTALTTIGDTPKNTPLMSSFRTSNSYFIQIHGSSTSTKSLAHQTTRVRCV